jgi:hypothetical protein
MDLVNFIEKLNWQTIIAMFVITWYFTHDIKLALEKQAGRTDKLYEMFIDLLKEKK